jgi:PAS domain S-box-containing protein
MGAPSPDGNGGETQPTSEEVLRDHAPYPYQSLNAAGELVTVNAAWLEVLGYDRDEVVGRWFGEFLVDGDTDRFDSQFRQLKSAGTVSDVEFELVRADGSTVIASFEGRVERDDEGNVVRTHCQFHEVTRQHDRASRLRRYEQVVRSSTNMLAAGDLNYNFVFANRAYREFHGIDPDADLRGRPFIDVLNPELFESIKPRIDRSMEGETVRYEMARTNADGDTRILDVQYFPLKADDGAILGNVSTARDITEIREREREVREQKRRYESLFDSIRDAIVVADRRRRIINCNPAFTELFGYDLAEIEGEPTKVIYESEADFEAMGRAIDELQEHPQAFVTINYEKRSGQVFPGETNLFYLRDADDAVVGFIGLVRDVSERAERNRQLKVLDRVLRHNLKNDVNVIEGFARTIEEAADPSIAASAETILETTAQVEDIIETERRITKLLSEPPEPRTVDLVPIVDRVVDETRDRHPNAELSVALPDVSRVRAATAIGGAVEELLENAIVHSESDRPNVAIAVENAADTARIHVRDDGPGIPEMERRTLTEGAEIEPLYHGSGLGLWYVNLVVRHSDGTLEFDENDPRGSVVTIHLPAA